MEESEGMVLVKSLKRLGIHIPPDNHISSISDINPTTLYSISTQSLLRLPFPATPHQTPSFPPSLPDSIPDRVRICTHLASALTLLGFLGHATFHKLLYPSEDDLYKLVRFLVERLSETSESAEIAELPDVHSEDNNSADNRQSTSEVSGKTDVVPVGKSNTNDDDPEKIDQIYNLGPSLGMLHISKESHSIDDGGEPTETLGDLRKNDIQREDAQGHVADVPNFIKESTSCQVLSSEEFDGQDCAEFQQSNKQVKSGKLNLQQLKDQWDNSRRPLQKDKILLLESLCVNNPDAQGKLQKLKDIDLETEAVLSEIRNREEVCAKLEAELEKQPKVASRRSYVERITEITKNSRKQNADIERILKETRELQLESNSIEERLHRSYAVVDEMVLREAKKDMVSHQAYRLLTNIHGSFEEIREKILETDRTRREVADIEAKLATIATRSLDMEKLQADLDAIKRENESLERKLHGPL